MRRLIKDRMADERGIVIVWMAITATVLFLMVGFAIDIGAWQLRAEKIQRATDSAALAGAAKMPNQDAAKAAVMDALAKNKISPSASLSVDITATNGNRVKVNVKDTNVKTLFAKFAVDHITLNRSSVGEYSDPVKLGSYANILGTGTITGSTLQQVDEQNYWAAINGYCTPKEEGDALASRYVGTKVDKASTTARTRCSSPATQNVDYDPNGYNYTIDLPAAGRTTTYEVRVYDAGYTYVGDNAPSTRPDVTNASQADLAAYANHKPFIRTVYKVYDMHGTYDTADDGNPVCTLDLNTDALNDAYAAKWMSICTLNHPLGVDVKYRLNVSTPQGDPNSSTSDRSVGVNAYGLWIYQPDQPVGPPNTTEQICDSRWQTFCPSVSAVKAFSLYANAQAYDNGQPTGGASFPLAEVKPDAAGHEVDINLWDPGEGADQMKLFVGHAPDGTQGKYLNFDWDAAPDCGNSSLHATGASYLPVAKTINCGGVTSSAFDGRYALITVKVPDDYSSYIPAPVKTQYGDFFNYWWSVEYKTNATPTDRTTWFAQVKGLSPLHLVQDDGTSN